MQALDALIAWATPLIKLVVLWHVFWIVAPIIFLAAIALIMVLWFLFAVISDALRNLFRQYRDSYPSRNAFDTRQRRRF